MAVAYASGYSSSSNPNLGISICCGSGPKKQKEKKGKKEKEKKENKGNYHFMKVLLQLHTEYWVTMSNVFLSMGQGEEHENHRSGGCAGQKGTWGRAHALGDSCPCQLCPPLAV